MFAGGKQPGNYTFPVLKYPSTKAPGNLASAFSGQQPVELPERYRELKRTLHNDRLEASWQRLLKAFEEETKIIKSLGSNVVPQIQFEELVKNGGKFPSELADEVRKRGCAVIRNVVEPSVALEYKRMVQEYIQKHPGQIVGFPENDPQVWELYWSKAQIQARSHPNFNTAAAAMNQLWNADPSTIIDLTRNLSYCDRLRIRQPKDTSFALAEHVDGGSVERWEDPEYRNCYSNILDGNWEKHDPFDATHRVNANMDLFNCSGGCSMFRSFQGWMSLSQVKPGGGTLRVCPLIKLSSAYMILRPLISDLLDTTDMAGASPGVQQNILPTLHAHIVDAVVSIPEVFPGDCVFWHCDGVHAVESFCGGTTDSSVLYIPSTPLCNKNAEYLLRQREAFVNGTSPPDFPLNNCELNFEDRGKPEELSEAGKQNMGLAKLPESENLNSSQLRAVREANKILLFT